jgi:hypothetical protein
VKLLLLGLAAGLTLGSTCAGIASSTSRDVTVHPGANITYAGLGLFCEYRGYPPRSWKAEPSYHDRGPVLACGRTAGSDWQGRLAVFTRFHAGFTNEAHNHFIVWLARAP